MEREFEGIVLSDKLGINPEMIQHLDCEVTLVEHIGYPLVKPEILEQLTELTQKSDKLFPIGIIGAGFSGDYSSVAKSLLQIIAKDLGTIIVVDKLIMCTGSGREKGLINIETDNVVVNGGEIDDLPEICKNIIESANGIEEARKLNSLVDIVALEKSEHKRVIKDQQKSSYFKKTTNVKQRHFNTKPKKY